VGSALEAAEAERARGSWETMGGGWEGLQLRFSLFDYALCPPTRRVAFIEFNWAAGAREQFGGPLRTAALDASVWRACSYCASSSRISQEVFLRVPSPIQSSQRLLRVVQSVEDLGEELAFGGRAPGLHVAPNRTGSPCQDVKHYVRALRCILSLSASTFT
jgi:hypothetical protein